MRFAGDMDVSQFMGDGPDYSELGQRTHMNDAKVFNAGLRAEGQVGIAGVEEFGATLGQKAVTEARGDYMAAQQQASNMSQMGGLLGNAIGGLGSLFG